MRKRTALCKRSSLDGGAEEVVAVAAGEADEDDGPAADGSMVDMWMEVLGG